MEPAFKWRHFEGEVILWGVRWYCKYGMSYRELEEMMGERGIKVDHTTLYRWVQRYAPELEKRTRWYRRGGSNSWRVDETFIKVKGKWKYLYRALDHLGNTLDFYLSARRNVYAATRFLRKALHWTGERVPRVINTDKNPTYAIAINNLKRRGLLPAETEHRQVKCLNNRLESDHGKIKRLIKTGLGFQSLKTAYATLKGIEVMRMFRKGQFADRIYDGMGGRANEVVFINQLFDLYA